jgi:amino acid transporter
MLRRRLGLLQAVSLNMSMMVGIGPFIMISTFVRAMNGPPAMLGWLLGAAIAIADGLVWCELAAAFSGSGGTYHYYDAVYRQSHVGRLLKFLFVWQFLFSGPLEVASGAIGVAQYMGYLWPALKVAAWSVPIGAFVWTVTFGQLLAMGVMAGITALSYRRIESAGRLMVVLWAGMLLTVAWVVLDGLLHFNPARAFDVPPDAWRLDRAFLLGLGVATGNAMYAYLGYYQVCYLGDEVEKPERTLPLSILVSVVLVALVYVTMNAGVLGVIPWRSVITSDHIATDMMLALHGPMAARLMTAMIVWTALAATFAALLSYSRVPYAAAASGHFFRGLAKIHPTGDFPARSLLLIAAVAMLACLADIDTVIAALLTSRIFIQFIGQVATVLYIRTRPDLAARLRFKMWLFPIPALVAAAGWLYVFSSTQYHIMAYGLVSLALGALCFEGWNALARAEGSSDSVSS